MRRILYREGTDGLGSVGVLILRLAVGTAFLFHGWGKIQHPTGWMGEGAPVPGPLQAAAAVSEFGGGIGLILGLLTPLACLGIAGTMTFAIVMVHLRSGHPFVNLADPHGPSWELAAAYLASVILILLIGPGRLSLDARLFGRTTESAPTIPRPE
jgi:putative oxidoreductase